ncbi:MAG TPA: protein kinase, partial [Kofleriaceae bacterium]|nr:protein kinase [Kofleriaceae bacterium]
MECSMESQVVGFAGDGAFRMTAVEEHIDQCNGCRALLAGLVRAEPTDAWYAGQRLGRYVLVEPIGHGGMGAVWRAEDVELERAVALKRLHAGGRDRLFREARTLAQLQHPNVVAIYEVVDDPQAPFLAMELVDGLTLRAWLREPRTWREIVAMLAQAGRGLAAAHARGLVHRDFKPDNVLVDRDSVAEPRARVADFGLASIHDGIDTTLATIADVTCERARFTHSIAGTPAYMAPELVEGAMPDTRTDVYAFAVTLFEALHGRHPFAGDNVRMMWLEMAAGRIRDGGKRIPAWLERCVRKGLAVDPAERWPDIASFVTALERRPRRRAAVAAVSFAACALAATAAWSAAPTTSDDCSAGSNLVNETWNPITRSVVVTKLAMGALDRMPVSSTTKIIDHWVKSWQFGRRTACSAGERRPARIACLDREVDELRSLLDAWSTGIGIERSVPAAAALPPPNACDSAADSPLIAQHIVLRIIEAKTLWREGRAAEAMPRIPALIRDAELIGHHDTLSQALLISSYIEHETGDDPAASLHARRAAAEASQSGDHAVLYSSLIQEAYQRIDEGSPADALGLCDAAEALAARGVPEPQKVHMARGGALTRLGRMQDAIAEYDKAIASLQPEAPLDPTAQIGLGVAFAARGNAYLLSRNPERALVDQQQALALQEASYGPQHPEVARTLYDIAQSLQDLNRLEETSTDLDRARAIFVASYGEQHPEVGQVDVARATNAKRRGNLDEARTMFEQARRELAPVLRPDHLLFSVIENQLGAIETLAGRCEQAIPHFEKGYAMLVANESGGEQLAKTDLALAQCLLEVGNHVDAKTHAQDALDHLSRAGLGDSYRAMPWMVLALVADRRGERAHAIDYARRVMASTSDDDTGEAG